MTDDQQAALVCDEAALFGPVDAQATPAAAPAAAPTSSPPSDPAKRVIEVFYDLDGDGQA